MARGRIFKRQGAYAFRVDLGPDPATGSRRQIQRQGFRTKREAEAALDEHINTIRSGGALSSSTTTVEAFLDEWLKGQAPRLKETTWESYRVVVNRVNARIGKVKVQSLTPLEIERFYSVLGESGSHSGGPLSVKSIRNTHTVLRKALSDAERLGLILRNPAASARPPADVRKEQKTWGSDELREFLETVAADRLYALYVLLATTGMRRGEALGLRWRDLDLDGAELHIVQTLVAINYQPVVTTPKTKRSRRLIYLDEGTVGVLRSHRAAHRVERLAAGAVWDSNNDLVFCDELGGMLNPDWISRDFRIKIRQALLRDIRLHDLRHTYATLALKSGVHPKVVSERLGHATVGITLDLYSHVTPAIGRDAADVVAARIFGS